MNYPVPLLLMGGPLVAAAVMLFLSRWQRVAAVVGTVVSLWLGLWIAGVPLESTAVTSAGRLFAGDTWSVDVLEFVLTEGLQALFLFLYVALGLLCLGSWVFPQGHYFIPASLAAFSLLSAALMVQPLTFGILFLMTAMAILAVVIQAEQVGSTQAAWRYLIMVVLAVPPFMVAGWALETGQAQLLALVSRLLVVGFIILLAGFPFHIWVNPVLNQASPLGSILLFSLVQLAIVAFLFDWLAANPWLEQDVYYRQVLRWSGVATVLLAGVAAATALTSGRLLGSLLLLDMGMAVLALSLSAPERWHAAVALHLVRFFSLLPATAGLTLLRRQVDSDEIVAKRGLGRQTPWSVALFVYGCLSLLGLPLTPGFGGRWTIVAALGQPGSGLAFWLPLLLLLAMIGGATGVLRGLTCWLQPPVQEAAVPPAAEQRWLRGLLLVTLVVPLTLALFPQMVLNYASRIADLLV